MSLSKEELMEKYEHAKKMVKLERKILEGYKERIEWNKDYARESIEEWEAKVERDKEALKQLGVDVGEHA